MSNVSKANERRDELAETKRIMERLVRTPPKPHKDKGGEKERGTAKQPRAPKLSQKHRQNRGKPEQA